MAWRGDITIADRLWGSLPYLLPMVSALPLGIPLMQNIPILAVAFSPLFSLAGVLGAFGGFSSLIVFLLLYFLVIRNSRINHFVRFNAMQALLLDIARFLVVLVVGLVGGLGLGFLVETVFTTLFLAVMGVSLYAWIWNAQGRYAEVPTLSEAAYAQVQY